MSAYPQRSLRVIAGIPESEHTAELLATRLPEDFSAQSFQNLSLDMMAELLLYLIAKNLLTVRVASNKALLDMPWGSHVCQFYNRKEDLVEMLVHYFKQGWRKMRLACAW